MEFNWDQFSVDGISQEVVAESFEDPFSLRFLPDEGDIAERSRFFSLGKDLRGQGIFSVYKSTGKLVTVIFARLMTEEETYFYERKMREAL